MKISYITKLILCVLLVERSIRTWAQDRGHIKGLINSPHPHNDHKYNICSTIKQGCTAGIKLILGEDGQHLVVTSVCNDHNHCINRVYAANIVIVSHA